MDKEDREFMEKNKLAAKFTADRSQRCLELMNPEVRGLVTLPLPDKIQKSKEIIRQAFDQYQNVGIGFSGGTDSLVLLHMVLAIKQSIPVVYVDTIREFPETYRFIDEVRQEWGIMNFIAVRAEEDRCDYFAEKLGYKTPEFMTEYCNDHKIVPMMNAIRKFNFDGFLVGLRGVEHEERATEVFFSPRSNPEHHRVHPLLFWQRQDILNYVKEEKLKCHPLYAKGYTSLGCTICSAVNTDPNAHERAGRGIVRETIMKKLRELGYT